MFSGSAEERCLPARLLMLSPSVFCSTDVPFPLLDAMPFATRYRLLLSDLLTLHGKS